MGEVGKGEGITRQVLAKVVGGYEVYSTSQS
jgi:hypothetical protein